MEHEKRKEQNIKQLIIEIPNDIHTKIKIAAARRNISMKLWVLRVLIRALNEEK